MGIAAGLVVVLGVDPFGLSNVSGLVATAAPTTETRDQNTDSALARVSTAAAVDAVPLTASAQDASGGGIPNLSESLPSAVTQTIEVVPGQPNTADVGGMLVSIESSAAETATHTVQMSVSDEYAAAEAGINGVLIDLVDVTEDDGVPTDTTSVELTVSYADFAGFAGADWASRLRFVSIPECIDDGSGTGQCLVQPLATSVDLAAQTVTAEVPVTDAASSSNVMAARAPILPPTPYAFGALALMAGASGSAGDWSKTNLPQSSSWGGGGSTGAFSWTYPMSVTPSAAGLMPDLTLSYSSAVSDGRVPSTNNQSGWIGEGFSLTSSYIEREYIACAADDKSGGNSVGRDTGDLCWGPDNATLVFNGAATSLVYDAVDDVWRSKAEDGTKAELLTGGWNGAEGGEYWKVTTVDGGEYFFGRGRTSSTGNDLQSAWTVPVVGNNSGEPCYHDDAAGGFAESDCTQVWRWNLDHVVDTAGNTMTYTYAKEKNSYVADYGHNSSWSTTEYVSGGHLTRIDYGTSTVETSGAPYRVVFDAANRCATSDTGGTRLCTGTQTTGSSHRWLDTPDDLRCSATSGLDCMNVTPTFFDTTRLEQVTAQSWDGTAYRDTDSWKFTQRFVGEGSDGAIDHAASITLRLESVQHTGHGGTASTTDDIALPAVKFGYMSLPNRVDSVDDGQSGLWRPRLTKVRTESGGVVNVDYRTECTPDSLPGTSGTAQAANTKLCYLVKWQPEGESEPQNHWFHKYVVDSIVEDATPRAGSGTQLVTGSQSRVCCTDR